MNTESPVDNTAAPQTPPLDTDPRLVWHTNNCLTPQEMADLRQIVDDDHGDATVFGAYGLEKPESQETVRRTQVHWLTDRKYEWLYHRMLDVVKLVNQRYDFDIKGITEPIQLAVYDESEQGFFDWHMDWGRAQGGNIRKVSLTVPINDPSEWEGGNFEINTNGAAVAVEQVMGTAIAFPSFAMHRVTPVTKGRRYSLVVWAGGSKFK